MDNRIRCRRCHPSKGREMTDREVLEMAAKAAGIDLWHEDVFTNGLTQKVSDNGVLRWNPLTDDGDALRLAVKLGIGFQCHQGRGDYVLADDGNNHSHCIWFGPEGEPLAATRRAITRAAAEIGRSME